MENKNYKSYKNLIVWKKSIILVVTIYNITKNFPSDERFGLVSQIRRCSVSIPSNIAEGSMRGSQKEFVRFLHIAFASGGELETQIEISKKLSLISDKDFDSIDSLLTEVMKMLNKLISSLVTRN